MPARTRLIGSHRVLLPALGAVAMAVVAMLSGDDRLGQVLACIALASLAWAAVSKYRVQERARG